jgi:predicted acetyltransferase
MQVEFRSHFSGKKCVLWARKYGKWFIAMLSEGKPVNLYWAMVVEKS